MWFLDVNDKLKELQSKINRIEENDSDFKNNEKWKELRRQQDLLYDYKKQEMENDGRDF